MWFFCSPIYLMAPPVTLPLWFHIRTISFAFFRSVPYFFFPFFFSLMSKYAGLRFRSQRLVCFIQVLLHATEDSAANLVVLNCISAITLHHVKHIFLTKSVLVPQMNQLLWRDKRLVERLGNSSPNVLAPGSPVTVAPQRSNTSWAPVDPVVRPEEPIFLMTSTAQTISGVFVWTALLITCHQVRFGHFQFAEGFKV